MHDLVTVLKNRRLMLNKTQQEISNNIYVSQNTFSDYENKRKEIKLSRLQDIAKELDGSIKFIPNENVKTVYMHQVSVIASDCKTKEILNSDFFKEEFSRFKEDLYHNYSYIDDIGEGDYEDDIVVNEKTIDNELFKDGRVLDVSRLNTKIDDITINNNNKIAISNIECSLIDLNEDTSSKIDLIICEKTYDFIKEFIEENMYTFFGTEEDYDNYIEEEELYVIYRVSPLYDKFSDSKADDKFKYFIR